MPFKSLPPGGMQQNKSIMNQIPASGPRKEDRAARPWSANQQSNTSNRTIGDQPIRISARICTSTLQCTNSDKADNSCVSTRNNSPVAKDKPSVKAYSIKFCKFHAKACLPTMSMFIISSSVPNSFKHIEVHIIRKFIHAVINITTTYTNFNLPIQIMTIEGQGNLRSLNKEGRGELGPWAVNEPKATLNTLIIHHEKPLTTIITTHHIWSFFSSNMNDDIKRTMSSTTQSQPADQHNNLRCLTCIYNENNNLQWIKYQTYIKFQQNINF